MTGPYKNVSRPDLDAMKARIAANRDALKDVALFVDFSILEAAARFAFVRRDLRDQEAEIDAELAIRRRTIGTRQLPQLPTAIAS